MISKLKCVKWKAIFLRLHIRTSQEWKEALLVGIRSQVKSVRLGTEKLQ